MAGGERLLWRGAFEQPDGVACPREHQRLPGPGDAGADHVDGRGVNGRFPPRRLKVLVHPCPFAGMTRIRFKGSPRSRAPCERAVSQLLVGAPLGTVLM